jgi:hypothetical protein
MPNISAAAQTYLVKLNAEPEELFFHAIAILHSPAFRTENQGALRQDWPRIPLPADKATLQKSAALGRQITALLDVESKIEGVNAPPLRGELQTLAAITRLDDQPINPDEGDLELTAGWGHAGKGGATMPGRGRTVDRPYTPEEAKSLGNASDLLGASTVDVFLNEHVYWRNIPVRVWEYTISGYAVIKKWLSYREKELLGRSLTVEEARYVTGVARRIAALLLLHPSLDESYSVARVSSMSHRLSPSP